MKKAKVTYSDIVNLIEEYGVEYRLDVVRVCVFTYGYVDAIILGFIDRAFADNFLKNEFSSIR